MHLPEELQNAIDQASQEFKPNELQKAAQQLISDYQNRKGSLSINKSPAFGIAYLNVRLPSIFAAITSVFREISTRDESLSISSLLDLGAGPGTASWACLDTFPEIKKITLIEGSSYFLQLGKKLARDAKNSLSQASWVLEKLENASFEPHDIVTMSYVANELDEISLLDIVKRAWGAANQFLFIIEPGDPKGFERIRKIRSMLLEEGAKIISPCPHSENCPIIAPDWCHFSERVARTKAQRFFKQGSLGHEDEKFAYLFVGKSSMQPYFSRILRHPAKHSGHVTFKLCCSDGHIHEKTYSQREKKIYKRAKKASWGNIWQES